MELRKELLSPVLDENKVAQLAKSAEPLDGCDSHFDDCPAVRSPFNSLAGSDWQIAEFHYSGGMDTDTFVRRADTKTTRD